MTFFTIATHGLLRRPMCTGLAWRSSRLTPTQALQG
jgi:hypothetical protein